MKNIIKNRHVCYHGVTGKVGGATARALLAGPVNQCGRSCGMSTKVKLEELVQGGLHNRDRSLSTLPFRGGSGLCARTPNFDPSPEFSEAREMEGPSTPRSSAARRSALFIFLLSSNSPRNKPADSSTPLSKGDRHLPIPITFLASGLVYGELPWM